MIMFENDWDLYGTRCSLHRDLPARLELRNYQADDQSYMLPPRADVSEFVGGSVYQEDMVNKQHHRPNACHTRNDHVQ